MLIASMHDALRGLRRSATFTAIVFLTLSVSIGAAVAMFGIVDQMYFRPISLMREPGTAHRVYTQRLTRQSGRVTSHSMNYGQYLDLAAMTSSFSEMAVFSEDRMPVGTGATSREVVVSAVSESYFNFFNARPALGRYFTPEEDQPHAAIPVAVLAYDVWHRDFGGRDVLGERLDVGSVRATIIGVAPEGFDGVDDANPPAVFIPTALWPSAVDAPDAENAFGYYRFGWANVLVRRAPSVTEAHASADLHQALQRSWDKRRALDPASLAPIDTAQPTAFVGPIRRAAGPAPLPEMRVAFWITGLSFVVLIVAAANVTNLQLARALHRQSDNAIRAAMGASRLRLAAEVLSEGALLALIAALGSTLIAHWAGSVVRAVLLPAQQTSFSVLSDLRLLSLTFGIALLVGVLTSLAPAWFASARALPAMQHLRVRGGARRPHRLRGVLAVSQVALSCALLIGALLFLKSLAAIDAVPLGYAMDQVLVVTPTERGDTLDEPRQQALRQTLFAEARRLPGVERASWVHAAPLWRSNYQVPFIDGTDGLSSFGQFNLYTVDHEYFPTIGTRIIRGRGLSDTDRAGAPPVVVVSESMATRLWPDRDPIGQCVRIASASAPCASVVGMAENVLMTGQYLQEQPRFQYYVSMEQYPLPFVGFLMLRVQGEPGAMVHSTLEALQAVMPGASYVTVQHMGNLVSVARRPWQQGARLFLLSAILALAVAAIGLYSVINYNVAQRAQEFSLRAALGAQRSHIVQLVLGQGIVFAGAGAVIGTAIAFAASSRLQPLLYRHSAMDPTVYGAVAGLAIGIAVVSTMPTALRSARLSPTLALRKN